MKEHSALKLDIKENKDVSQIDINEHVPWIKNI